jgi:hypothetical protein
LKQPKKTKATGAKRITVTVEERLIGGAKITVEMLPVRQTQGFSARAGARLRFDRNRKDPRR